MELELQRETRSSIELTLNAKRDYQFSIKIYFENGLEDEALARIEKIDAALRSKYLPYTNVFKPGDIIEIVKP